MPIYEYRCKSCDVVIEKRQKFSDPLLTNCAQCGGPLERLISAPGLRFKGTGWYVTDYARSGAGDDNGGEKKTGEPATESKKTAPATSKSTANPAKKSS